MCMYEDSEPVTHLNDGEYRIARKQHTCAECRRAIAPGERYHYEAFIHDGRFSQHKTCAHCMVARDWLGAECGGWVFGGVEEDLREHAESFSHYGMPVARLYVAMSHNWKRRDGSLRQVPARPMTTHQRLAT